MTRPLHREAAYDDEESTARDASISTLDTDISRKNSYSPGSISTYLAQLHLCAAAHKTARKENLKLNLNPIEEEGDPQLRHKTSLKYVGTKVKTNYASRKRS